MGVSMAVATVLNGGDEFLIGLSSFVFDDDDDDSCCDIDCFLA